MLIKALHDTEYGPEGKMHWELFNKDISVSLGEGADLAYAESSSGGNGESHLGGR